VRVSNEDQETFLEKLEDFSAHRNMHVDGFRIRSHRKLAIHKVYNYNTERSHYAVIKEKTREETSSMNIHIGYFPIMVSVP
jgi:hypothetical protein